MNSAKHLIEIHSNFTDIEPVLPPSWEIFVTGSTHNLDGPIICSFFGHGRWIFWGKTPIICNDTALLDLTMLECKNYYYRLWNSW